MKLNRAPARGRRAGFSLVEVLLASSVLVVTLGGVMALLVSSTRLEQSNWEMAEAHNAARSLSEVLQAMDPDEVFALFNDDPKDDPDGEGTAPGVELFFPSQSLSGSDIDLMTGTIEFPEGAPKGPAEDGDDLQAIYPVTVVVRWPGSATGASRQTTQTVMLRKSGQASHTSGFFEKHKYSTGTGYGY